MVSMSKLSKDFSSCSVAPIFFKVVNKPFV
jgi:hypothetical protein